MERLLKGILKGAYDNSPKSDRLVVALPEGEQIYIWFPPGQSAQFKGMNGSEIQLKVTEGEYQGKPSFSSDSSKVMEISSAGQTNKSSGTNSRDASIIRQVSAKLGVEMAVYNAGASGRAVTIDDVVAHALEVEHFIHSLAPPVPEAKKTSFKPRSKVT